MCVARCLPFYYVENHILGELVEFGAIAFKLLDFFLELGCLGLIADYFYHRAPGSHPQFREKVAYQLHVGVVDPIKTGGVGTVDNYDSFNHRVEGFRLQS